MRLSSLPLFWLLAGSQVLAAPAANPSDQAYATATQIERSVRGQAARTFIDTNSDPYEQGERWSEAKPRKPGADPLEGMRYVNSARVWKRQGKTALAEVESNSFAGDWTRTTRYFFRLDGSLAKLDSTLSTSYSTEASPLVIRQSRTYDASGRALSTSTSHRDGRTGRGLKVAGSKYLKNEAPVYLRVSKLPFYTLLRKAPR